MAAPRTRSGATPPTKNIAPLVGALAPIAAVAATLYGLPGGIAALIVVVAAAWMSTPPLLTGKGRGGAPAVNPEDPREQSAMLTYRRWASLKWAFAPSASWLPNDMQAWQSSDAGKADAAPLARVKAAALWLLVPQAFVTWIGVGIALIALAMPTGRLETWFPRDLHGSTLWLAPLNAIAAYAVIRGVESARRATAAPEDPQPSVTIEHLTKARDGKLVQTIIPTAVVVLGVAAAVVVVLNVSRLAAAVPLPIVAGVGAGIVAGAGMLRAVSLPGAHDEWRQLVAARERWDGVFRQMKLDPAPRLTGHRILGETEDSTSVVIDTFDVPGEMGGADGFVKLRDKVAAMVATGGMQDVTILNSPALDREGQPVAGSKSATSVRIVVWPAEITADVTDPELDPELAKLRIETFTAGVVIAAGWFQPVLTELDVLTVSGSPVVARTVWSQVESAPMFASALKAGAGAMGSPVAVDMGAGDTVYFGALYDENVEYADESAGDRLATVFREAAWHLRWKESLKGKQNPWIQSDVYRQFRLPSGQIIDSQPFMQGQGLSLDDYINPEVEKLLTTTLDNAPFVSITGWGGAGDRDGARHPGAFRVLWSAEPVPTNPARITPSPTRDPAVTEGIKVVLGAAVNAGFDAAKMPRPEIVRSVALTSRASEGHIWDLTLRLYGGVTISDVKARIEKIRQGLGGVPWLRVTADANNPDWARLVAGVDPARTSVTFSRSSNQDICTALNWEQAFADAKVIGTGGTTPTLVRSAPLENNPKVLELDFRLPPGTSRGMVHEARKKLMPATGNVYLEDMEGPTPDIVRLRTCPEAPVPFPAPYDWGAVERSRSIPFASGVTGEPIEFDWKESPHLILLGGTGSGKSMVLTNFIAGALIRGCEVYVADPTKVAADFRFAEPWLKAMPLTIPETSAMMDLVYDEVKRRRAVNGQYGVASYTDLPAEVRPPHIVVVIDEFTSLMFADPIGKLADGADEDEVAAYREAEAEALAKRNIGAKAGRFVREARSMGVTLILAGQELKSDTIQKIPGGTSLKGNSSSILLGNPSLGTRQSALKDPYNVPDLGDTVPKGRGLYEALGSKAQIIQSWYDAPDHTGSLTEHIAAVRAPLEPSERPDLTVLVKKVDDAPVFGRRIDDRDPIILDAVDDEEIIDVGVVEIDLGDDLEDLFGDMSAEDAGDPVIDPLDEDLFDIPLPDLPVAIPGTSESDLAPTTPLLTATVAGAGVAPSLGDVIAADLPDGALVTGSRELDAILAWAQRERPGVVRWRTADADTLHPSGMTNAELLSAALGDEQIELEVLSASGAAPEPAPAPPQWNGDDVFGEIATKPMTSPVTGAIADDLFG